MPSKSISAKLAALKKKKDDLDAAIKEMEQEEAQQLRRERHERARVIGMAMLRMVEDDAVADWSEEKLLDLVSPFVVSGKEKRLLGVSGANKTDGKQSKTKAKKTTTKNKKRPTPSTSSKIADTDEVASHADKDASAKTPVVQRSDDELEAEFNL